MEVSSFSGILQIQKLKGMAYVSFFMAMLILSAYARNIMKTGTSSETDEKAEQDSAYELFSRQNVKRLLSKAILRPKKLPKLHFRKLDLGEGSELIVPEMPHKQSDENQGASTLIAAGLPKLVASLPKLAGAQKSGKSKASSTTGVNLEGQLRQGPFAFMKPKAKPTWLMRTGDMKAETCRTESFNQTVSSKGCRPIVIESRLCTGRCNSFFVPSSDADFQSCSSCFPSDFTVKTIILDCPMRKRGYKIKQVHVIKNCKCQSMMSCAP